MKPQDMTELHNPPSSIGDCMRACVASILEVESATLPHFGRWVDEGASVDEMHQRMREYLREHFGFDLLTLDPQACNPKLLPAGYCVACGESPRFKGVYHDVVWFMDEMGGHLVHDPHPSRDGIVGPVVQVQYYVPVEPRAH